MNHSITAATASAWATLSVVVAGGAQLGNIPRDSLLGCAALQELCHSLSVKSGWWDGVDKSDPLVFGHKLALVHSEISESLEGDRKGLMDKHLPHRTQREVELADALARIYDLGGAYGFDLAGALIEKLAYNQSRADHKAENRETEGGKAY